MSDVPTSATVAGTASPSSSRTGRPVAMLRPQSPRTNRASQMAYCAARGRSSPRARRWAASCAGVAVGPSSRSTGSPGASRTSTNVSVTTPVPTTARDVAWTLSAARDAATAYPRLNDFADVAFVNDPNDSTVVIRFAHSQDAIPDVLTDLAILPARLLDSIPRTELRRAAWNEHPIGNGPFRFVAPEAGRRGVFAANRDFPAAPAGPPALERFIVVVVDEPTTKLAALTSGEIDFAGIQPAHAAFVRKNPALAVLDYPLIMPYGIVFNTRNPPFDDPRVRLAVALALDRREIVDGYLFGFGSVADGPGAPGVPGYAPVRRVRTDPR